MDNFKSNGLPLALNPLATSASSTKPAFLATPEGAPVYHGFSILEDVVVDGFGFGAITDFESEPTDWGDAFVIAPDGSRAGIVWEFGTEPLFQQVLPIERGRWGVWGVTFLEPMKDREAARKNLAAILPELKDHWREWQEKYGHLAAEE